ncbi:hypothetical protein [Bradyrhizobium sp. USDA 3315]
MPCDDAIVVIDQDRVGESEPLDRLGDLGDLLLGMGAGVIGARVKIAGALVGQVEFSGPAWII